MSAARRGARSKLPVIQPDDAIACPLLTPGSPPMRARTCAERQHARAQGSPRGARYYPCSYLILGERERRIEFRCEEGRTMLFRMQSEWWPENWKPKQSDPRKVARHNAAKRAYHLTHMPGDRIDGRSV